ncbi:MAG: hypothetical protein RLZZ292_3447, partial [Bacteroidota bacterium]
MQIRYCKLRILSYLYRLYAMHRLHTKNLTIRLTMKPFLLFLPFFLFINSLTAQKIIYVNAKNINSQLDGNSWKTAYKDLQIALTQAQYGDSVWVARGIYYPTNDSNRDTAFELKSGVKVYGGFDGTEQTIQQRNFNNHKTILCGNIGNPLDSTDNSYNVVLANLVDSTARLDGFVVQEGYAVAINPLDLFDSRHNCGAGLYIYAKMPNELCNPCIENCIFTKNIAQLGAGIYANGRFGGIAIPFLKHCTFSENYATIDGAGMNIQSSFFSNQTYTIQDCHFINNQAFNEGGGISLAPVFYPIVFEGCSFTNNQVKTWGSAIYYYNETVSSLKISNCIFSKNLGNSIYFDIYKNADIFIEKSIFNDSETLNKEYNIRFTDNIDTKLTVKVNQCIFKHETASAISFPDNNDKNDKYEITNCVFHKNKDFRLIRNIFGQCKIRNCIFTGQSDSIKQLFYGLYYDIDYCLFQTPQCGLFPKNICGNHNLFASNPLFSNPTQNDFHLSPCSPAINAGDNAVLDSLGITTDIEGKPRIAGARVDIGAYERQTFFDALPTIKGSCTGQQGSVAFTVQEGTAPYTYQWQQGATSGTSLNNLAQGTYQFTVSDAAGCKDSLQIVVPKATSAIQLEGILKNDIRCFGEK